MASDPFKAVDSLARSLSKTLGESYEDLSFDRSAAYRRIAFSIHEAMLEERDRTLQFAAEALDDVLKLPSTPKRWMPGLKEGAKVLRTLAATAKLRREFDVDNWGDPEDSESDPLEWVEAGDEDPFDGQIFVEACGHEGEGGYTCTRPPHPSSWQHFDTDASDSNWLDLSGEVLATWDSTGGLTSLHPEIIDVSGEDPIF